MFNSFDVFDGPVLTRDQFDEWLETFSFQSNYLYRNMSPDGADLYPKCPFFIDRTKRPMIYIVGLVTAYKPGRAILQGIARVKGYKPDVHRAFENIDIIPAQLEFRERKRLIDALRKRMDESILVLAENAGLEDAPSHNRRHAHAVFSLSNTGA